MCTGAQFALLPAVSENDIKIARLTKASRSRSSAAMLQFS